MSDDTLPNDKSTRTRLFYLRNADRHPVGCFAFQIHGDTVHYGLALCHESDLNKWDRKLAKQIAEGRLNRQLTSPDQEDEEKLPSAELQEESAEEDDMEKTRIRVKWVRGTIDKIIRETGIPVSLTALCSINLRHGFDRVVASDLEMRRARRDARLSDDPQELREIVEDILSENRCLKRQLEMFKSYFSSSERLENGFYKDKDYPFLSSNRDRLSRKLAQV